MFVSEIKEKIKDAWLDYYEQNQEIVGILASEKYGERVSYDSKPYRYRCNSSFIIGVLCSLDSEISQFIKFSMSLNGDLDAIIEALGLNESPKVLYEKREEEREQAEQEAHLLPPVSPLDDIRQLNQKNQA
jgi:hypothetical protein